MQVESVAIGKARQATRADQWRKQALADSLRLLAEVSRTIVLCLVLALPVLLRLACAGAALAGAVYAGPRVWLAFGADAVALFPATAVVLLPLAATQGARLSWGGLVMAGALTAGIGMVVGQASDLVRALLVIAALATVVYHFQPAHEGGTTNEQGER
jgi:hypothetical protein